MLSMLQGQGLNLLPLPSKGSALPNELLLRVSLLLMFWSE